MHVRVTTTASTITGGHRSQSSASAEQISYADIGANCVGEALVKFVENLNVALLLLSLSLGRSAVLDGAVLLV